MGAGAGHSNRDQMSADYESDDDARRDSEGGEHSGVAKKWARSGMNGGGGKEVNESSRAPAIRIRNLRGRPR